MSADALRRSAAAEAIRRHRLVVVLRRVEPRDALLALVDELVEAGARIFEITFDAPSAAADVAALRERVGDAAVVGAGTLTTPEQVDAADDAGAAFGVAPTLDLAVLERAVGRGLPFVPGAFTPTEIATARSAGATMVKLFPASALGPSFVRELRGPMPDVELVPTGGIDAAAARAFLDAGAVAVGVGGALVRGDAAARRAILEAVQP